MKVIMKEEAILLFLLTLGDVAGFVFCLGSEKGRTSGVPRNFVWGRGSTNSVEDRGQTERGSGGR